MQSDLFAFGVILYELVSGRHPFVRPDAEELQGVRAIQFADPPSLKTCCPEVPDELASVIDRCLKKNPADRYASAADVREALKTIMRTKQFETGAAIRCAGECAAGGAGEALYGHAVHAGGAFSRVGG